MKTVSKTRKRSKIPSRGAVDDRNTIEGQMVGSFKPPKTSSADQVEEYLSGLEFPVSKIGMFRYAQRNNAPTALLLSIDRLPPKSYRSIVQVIGEMKIFSAF